MHAALQPGGRSPKQVNGPTSTSQLKPSDKSQNSGTSFPSQVKGKKRERADHSIDAVKRERFSRIEDGDSAQYKIESSLKTEIGRITEKGVVMDMEGVERLIQLMQHDRMERKIDLSSRSLLANVIAATDKFDCLNRFVQLRGLLIMDEWLQDIHKGKIGDSTSSKESDKSVEDFLLVLLRALDKLPVNLQSLQMCNIGRSVNHLRSHKQLEIQRKARSLVETWKKRVEAEMISIEAKSGSTQAGSVWPSKSRLPEASHSGSRIPNGSDAATKNSITQPSTLKTTAKSSHVESNTKSASSSPGPVKPILSPGSLKESQPRLSDVPVIREDRSSSSNHSHNDSQSFSGKDDGKSSTAVSAAVSKVSNSSSRNRKTNGSPGISVPGVQKETSSCKSSSAPRSSPSEKLSQSSLTSDKVLEGPIIEGSSHKLIVKIPNRVLSPGQGVKGASLEDPSIISSRVSSPVISEKNEQLERKEKSDSYRYNGTSDTDGESCQMNDVKDVLTRSAEGSRSPSEPRKSTDGPRENHSKSGKPHDASFSHMNALVESCVKYSEAQSSLSVEDDVGMNLLATVAVEEVSRSDFVSPTDSTERSVRVVQKVLNADDVKSKSLPESNIEGGQSSSNDIECDNNKEAVIDGNSSNELSGNIKLVQQDTPAGRPTGHDNKQPDCPTTADPKLDSGERQNEKIDVGSLAFPTVGVENKENHEEKGPSSHVSVDATSDCKSREISVLVAKDKVGKDLINSDEDKPMVEVASPSQLHEFDDKSDVNKGLNSGTISHKKVTGAVTKSERADNGMLQRNKNGLKLMSKDSDEVKVREPDEKDKKGHACKVERENINEEVSRNTAEEVRRIVDLKSHHIEANLESKEISEHLPMREGGCAASAAHETQKNDVLVRVKSAGTEPEGAISASSVAETASFSAVASVPDARMKFDLNEGFMMDDGKCVEPVKLASSCSTSIHMINSMPFGVNSISGGHSASITVAAAAKGPFVPPEDLLRNKIELGWKGSAATSAFRPAEPRKALEFPLACNDASTSKHGHTILDFDLNVPDERVLEEMASQDSPVGIRPTLPNDSSGSMLDLDLNRADESNEGRHCSTSSHFKGEGSFLHARQFVGLSAGDVCRDFDLNDGPRMDDANTEQLTLNQQAKGSMPSQHPASGFKMSSTGLGNFSSWFLPGNSYSTIPIPPVLPDRGDQSIPVIQPGAPQRTFTPAGITPSTTDVYQGSVLSSSAAQFQYPMFPFGATFPLPSASFSVGAASYADPSSGTRVFAPSVNSMLLGPVGAISNQFQRPYMVSLPESSSGGGFESTRKWNRQGLDLNAGPGVTETEVREDMLPLSSSQLSATSLHALAEEQARMYSVSGGILKRKEPEGGWDNESFRYKQSSWQ